MGVSKASLPQSRLCGKFARDKSLKSRTKLETKAPEKQSPATVSSTVFLAHGEPVGTRCLATTTMQSNARLNRCKGPL
jgi:hypothetical protein